MPVADTAILARMADGVILVVEAGRTRRDAAIRSKQVLQNAGARFLGVVLNRLAARNTAYTYYYRRYYGADADRIRNPASPQNPKRSGLARVLGPLTRR